MKKKLIKIDVSKLSKEEVEEIIAKVKKSFKKIDPVIEEIKPVGSDKNSSMMFLGLIFLGWLIYMIYEGGFIF